MTVDEFKADVFDRIPEQAGVYQFVGEDEVILYVGKAVHLKSRVSSYFSKTGLKRNKTRVLIKKTKQLTFTVTNSEQDALLLENSLVKKHQPRYNVQLKDGKTYPYICIKKERFPRVFITRRVIQDGSKYFGPYTSKTRLKVVLELVRQMFPLRNCNFNLSQEHIEANKYKVCLEYHIKNCEGPCVGFEEEGNYNEKIAQINNILKGHFRSVKSFFNEKMQSHATALEFEQAEQIKVKLDALHAYQSKSTVASTTLTEIEAFAPAVEGDRAFVHYLKINDGAVVYTFTLEMEVPVEETEKALLERAIIHIRSKFHSTCKEILVPFPVVLTESDIISNIPIRGEKRSLLELAQRNVKFHMLQWKASRLTRAKKQTSTERILTTMRKDLNLEDLPVHIECFDNSNIQGSNPVASVVVFRNARPAKKDYRKFNIKTVSGADDFASMREVVHRRYKRMLQENDMLPDLIVIDGGKGQLNAALKSLQDLGVDNRIAIIGIAKRLEEIYFPGDPVPLHLNKKSESLRLIQQLRNEAHRFAISFHRDKRSKDQIRSELDQIPGIGPKTKEQLMKAFKSVKRLKVTDFEEVQKIIGKAKTKILFDYFASKDGNS